MTYKKRAILIIVIWAVLIGGALLAWVYKSGKIKIFGSQITAVFTEIYKDWDKGNGEGVDFSTGKLRLNNRTDWFRDAGWGVFTHYLADTIADGKNINAEDWNMLVDNFDVEGLANQLELVGAKYYFITLGQRTGFYISPCPKYDKYVNNVPSKCSRRDLVNDLSDALSKKEIKLMVYMPALPPSQDDIAMQALEWNRTLALTENVVFQDYKANVNYSDGEKRQVNFQLKWEDIIREFSLRWGEKVAGWWVDGIYYPDTMYRYATPPNFESFAAALRAGNPNSIIAFNPGVVLPGHPALNPNRQLVSMSEHQDYTAGEIYGTNWMTESVSEWINWMPEIFSRWINSINSGISIGNHQAQYHTLSPLAEPANWNYTNYGSLRFTDDFVTEYVREINEYGGVVTWDVPIQPNGLIPDPFISQLKALHEGLSMPRPMTPPGNLASRKPAKLMNISGTEILWPSGHKPSARYGVDGYPQTWAQAGGEWAWGYWVDLKDIYNIKKVVLTFAPSLYAKEYKIKVSVDGTDWKDVVYKTDSNGNKQEHVFESTPAHYVFVQGLKPDGPDQPGIQMGIAELEVYE